MGFGHGSMVAGWWFHPVIGRYWKHDTSGIQWQCGMAVRNVHTVGIDEVSLTNNLGLQILRVQRWGWNTIGSIVLQVGSRNDSLNLDALKYILIREGSEWSSWFPKFRSMVWAWSRKVEWSRGNFLKPHVHLKFRAKAPCISVFWCFPFEVNAKRCKKTC